LSKTDSEEQSMIAIPKTNYSETSMDNHRRHFTKSALLISGAALLGGRVQASPRKAPFVFSSRSRAFVQTLGIRYPIVQAVIGGAPPELAAAVSSAGGLGGMGLSWSSEAEVRQYIETTKKLTTAPFAVGYVLSVGASTLSVALEAGAPIIQFSFGIPTARQVEQIRQVGAKFGVQISSPLGARKAIEIGADYISCQGQEAGGHIQAQTSWRDQIDRVLAVARTTPVLVAGGLADGHDLRAVLSKGAAGGVFGTRFVATREYPAHPMYKQKLLAAKASDTCLTVCFDGGWPNVLHRVLRNSTLDEWEAQGVQPEGRRPGEGEVVGHLGEMAFERYSIFPPFTATSGQVEAMAMYAGTGVGRIRHIASASTLVQDIWHECAQG